MPKLETFVGESLHSLPEEVLAAVINAPLPRLDDGPPAPQLIRAISEAPDQAWGTVDPVSRSLCTSGLWLLAGELDRSHEISQDHKTAEGSFWHAIMHRREGDFGNSKYWFGRVGGHPVIDHLAQLTGGHYEDPMRFVDQCSRVIGDGSEMEQHCMRSQWSEWQALMVYCLTGQLIAS